MGYFQAGFDVVGIDIHPQPHFPFRFIHMDVFEFFDRCQRGEYPQPDVWHCSPPCQRFSIAGIVHRNAGKEYPDYVMPIYQRLKEWGGPWVIENVVGVPILSYAVTLCGLSFGLKVFRHRVFQSSRLLLAPPHFTHAGLRIGEGMFSVAGHAGRWKSWGTVSRNVSKGTAAEWREAMGIHWMTRTELCQAIPPAYTCYLGKLLMN